MQRGLCRAAAPRVLEKEEDFFSFPLSVVPSLCFCSLPRWVRGVNLISFSHPADDEQTRTRLSTTAKLFVTRSPLGIAFQPGTVGASSGQCNP